MSSYQKWMLTGLFTASASLLVADSPSDQNAKAHTPPPPQAEITPPAGLRTDDGAKFLLTADFIYWQIKQDGLNDFGGAFSTDYSGLTRTGISKGSKLDFKYAPGFKVGAGVAFDPDHWDLFANYTWLQQNNAHGRTSSFINNNDTRSGQRPEANSIISNKANWTCHFNALDLELGRSFFISRKLILRPHFGLKTSWMKQKYNVSAFSNELAFEDSSGSSETTIGRSSQDFWGIGLRAGLNTAWHFTPDWSIYGNIAASELSCHFKEKSTITATYLTPPPELINTTQASIAFHTMRPVLEISLGLRYETLFSKDRYQFFIQTGWEQQIWWNQNNHLPTSAGDSGVQIRSFDLTMQGLDIKVGFAW